MSYKIVFDRTADKDFRRLPSEVQQAFSRKLSALADDPHPSDSRKLEGTHDCYRIRQGDYRLIYTVTEDRIVVLILRVGHRSSIYRAIPDLGRAVRKRKGNDDADHL